MSSGADGHAEFIEPSPLTWIGSDRRLARRFARPMMRFLKIEAAGGVIMLLTAAAAVVWANSPWKDSYHSLLETHMTVNVGSLVALDDSLEGWVNDALMVVFFFVVGIEIKRELVAGELRRPAAALLPAFAALGGMIVPALIYVAWNAGGPGSPGWGIPMATDIAFAVGVVSVLGSRVPNSLKIFLLTLAIVDDIGAIAVIAIFYTDDLSWPWLLIAGLTVLLIAFMRLARIWYAPAYLVVGVFLWLAVFESGVHATIAGVILGIFTPARPLVINTSAEDSLLSRLTAGSATASTARRVGFEIREQVSVADRLAGLLHPWTSFVIVPVFALVNAGVPVSSESLRAALSSPVTIGIVWGLALGKPLGVSLFSWLAVRSGYCELPAGGTWPRVLGIGCLSGIGFTVSLFITGLAFSDAGVILEAKMGIILASAMAAVVGAIILRTPQPRSAASEHR